MRLPVVNLESNVVKPTRFQKVEYGAALAAILCAATLGWLRLRQPFWGNRVYRIGWMISPPFQLRGDDGKPGGLSVDLVREAARRRGIDLQWVFWHDSSESALRKKAVDLWPLITITPERRKTFYISEPYLESEYSLLVRTDSSYRTVQDFSTAAIGLANPSIDVWQLRRRLPAARPLARPLLQSVMEDVCQKRTDAAFMDSYTAISALLEGGACAGRPLRWIAVPEVRSRLGVGATFENRAVADAIREEIGSMAAEGKLAPIIGRWGYLAGQHLESR
jgi:ABC-type amino acid transport substrate-binding protein